MPKHGGKSDLDAQRDFLDSLMGINRNNDREKDNIRDFRDERVCRFFLTGMCPHDLFVNTKMDEGSCPKVHSDELKENFQKSGDLCIFDYQLEKEFTRRLAEADRIIKRARLRVEDDKDDEETNPEINPDIIRIHAEMSKIIQQAEQSVAADDIDTAQDLIYGRLDDLNKEKQFVMNRINEIKKQRAGANSQDKKLRVCDVCGSFLSILDSDKRLQDHFLGKQHIGFQYMRDTLEAINKRREERRNQRGGNGAVSGSGTGADNASASRDDNDDRRGRGDKRGRSGGRRDNSRERGGRGGYRGDYRDRSRDRRGRSGSRERYNRDSNRDYNNRDRDYRDSRDNRDRFGAGRR